MCNQENKSNDILFWNLINQSRRENDELRELKYILENLMREALA